MRQLIVRPFKIIEDHRIINLVVAPPFTLVFRKRLTLYIFLMSLACLVRPAPGTLKRQIKDKEDISLPGFVGYSLSQLKLPSLSLELILSLLILLSCLQIYFLLITFKYMLMYTTYCYAENFLYLRKWLRKSMLLSWCGCSCTVPFDIWTPR